MLFNTSKLPVFSGLNYTQRMLALEMAKEKLPLPKKAVLHTIKFLLIAPVFFLIANDQSWSVLAWIFLLFLLYPLVTKPLSIYFVRSYLSECVEQIKQSDDKTS
ncbi:hypothetical protein GCM10008107_09950 [Psychrosphaera saromensis]|uniref:Uncharacterized protein n=1 Tax=Psychrosphaera saromensis TaxID=716813 RepID=A0A2S7UW38_9GAMM|nr:DUF6170 family protein [Psychrosphaera saromensis]PQJ53722.1 hypothetical protein BTO11_08615 [Psychrosphaera saromensis]GHB62862.1 hypothetical protein GCM10008107_09950 [Psychrosphaera saromensis]GLQ15498.1 hypothetical protein GCM10007917_29530 [Psychrosphaera saromensis]